MAYAGSKVPKISEKDLEIIKFRGSLEDFDRYDTAASDLFGKCDPSLISWIRKFSYLKQTLPEKDQKKLLGYTQDAQGYTDFWVDLKISYGSKADQVFYWKRRLEKIPKVTKTTEGKVKVYSLRAHYEDAKLVLRQLAKHGKDGRRFYEEYLPLLAGRLDQQSALEWGLYFKTNNLDSNDKDVLTEYLSWIKTKFDFMNAHFNDFKMCNPQDAQKSNNGNGSGNNGNKGKVEVN